jgi:hypothetical protein
MIMKEGREERGISGNTEIINKRMKKLVSAESKRKHLNMTCRFSVLWGQ